MNTSKEYIKMCEKTGEMQTKHKWQERDLFWCPGIEDETERLSQKLSKKIAKILNRDLALGIYSDKHLICEFCGEENNLYPFDKFFPSDEVIWLPRQDQLQEMYYKDDGRHSIDIINTFQVELFGNLRYYDKFNSMEQLWLAFVMKEKYNKIWNGEDWEKEKNGTKE